MNLKHQIWMYFGNCRLGLLLIKYYGKKNNIDLAVVDKNTDLVIEGYPRSANTSAVAAFRIANNYELKLAHHVHGAAQVKLASRLGIPCMVLVRDPIDSIVSLCMRDKSISQIQAIRNYNKFYKGVLPLRSSFVVAKFDDVLNDLDSVIERVNSRFNTKFLELGESMSSSDGVRSLVERMDIADTKKASVGEFTVALPSRKKKELSGKLRKRIESDPMMKDEILKSYEMYRLLVSI